MAMRKMRMGSGGLICVATALLFAGGFLLSRASDAAKQAAPAGVNLYQDVMSHEGSLTWVTGSSDNYPDDACGYLDACSASGAPKVYVLPVATIDGHRVGRAVYLVKTKDPKGPAVVFEHQTSGQTYFFRVAPDGSILHTAYLERGNVWLLIANSLGQPVFNKDAPDWHAALTKTGGKAGQ